MWPKRVACSMGPKRSVGMRRVVVTGWGIVSPLGRNSVDTFSRMTEGKSGIDRIKSFDTAGLPCDIAGEVPDDWVPDLPPICGEDERKWNTRCARLMFAAVSEAAQMSGLENIEDRNGIGASFGAYGETTPVDRLTGMNRHYSPENGWDVKGLLDDPEPFYFSHFRSNPDMVASSAARLFDLRGPGFSVCSACAAGAQAVGEAFRAVRNGLCDVMVAGGAEAPVNLVTMAGFIRLKALAERYDSPQEASRPFDRKRSGFVVSEGSGALVLESLEHALARNATILGEIAGYGASADAYRITDSRPDGDGARRAMEAALRDASLSPGDVHYINAHGTGTRKNDLAETRAIRSVFGDRAGKIPVSSNKSMLGHTVAATGAIELILTFMGMNRDIVLPTINRDHPDPECDLWVVPHEAIQRRHSVALSNSFGFGGQNACLCARRWRS